MISVERFRRPAGWRIGGCPALSRHCRDGIVPQPSVSAFLTRLSSGWPTRPPFLIIGARKPAGVSPLPLRLAAPGVGSIAPHPCKKRKDGPPAPRSERGTPKRRLGRGPFGSVILRSRTSGRPDGTVEIKIGGAGSIVPTLRKPRRVGQPAVILDPEKGGPAPFSLFGTPSPAVLVPSFLTYTYCDTVLSHHRAGSHRMAGATDERRTLELVRNHAEFKATLVSLTMSGDLHLLDGHVSAVARKWFELGRQHYADASSIDPIAHPRCAYSRAYYAAYNASKAVRYVVRGAVSLKGDDHRKVADLPDKFPDVDSWTAKLPQLYEHRLRADYDNSSNTSSENVLPPQDCIRAAREFLEVAAKFLLTEYGLTV